MAEQPCDYSATARMFGSQALLDSNSYAVRDCAARQRLDFVEYLRPLLDCRRPGRAFDLTGLVVRLLHSEGSAVRAIERTHGLADSSGPQMDGTESVPAYS